MNMFALLLLFLFGGDDSTFVKTLSKYQLDEKPIVEINSHIQGIWKMKEDTNYNNYFVVECDGTKELSITYMNCGGDSRGLEHAGGSFSVINGVRFFNAPFSNYFSDKPAHGVKLLRIDEPDDNDMWWKMTVTEVVDTNLYKMKSSAELRAYVAKNMQQTSFYGKSYHFRKKFEFNSFR